MSSDLFSFVGGEAKKLFDDADRMLNDIMETKSLRATGVVAFFPANSVGDDVYVFEHDNDRKAPPRAVFYGLRQQVCERKYRHLMGANNLKAFYKSSKLDVLYFIHLFEGSANCC